MVWARRAVRSGAVGRRNGLLPPGRTNGRRIFRIWTASVRRHPRSTERHGERIGPCPSCSASRLLRAVHALVLAKPAVSSERVELGHDPWRHVASNEAMVFVRQLLSGRHRRTAFWMTGRGDGQGSGLAVGVVPWLTAVDDGGQPCFSAPGRRLPLTVAAKSLAVCATAPEGRAVPAAVAGDWDNRDGRPVPAKTIPAARGPACLRPTAV